MPNKGPIDKGSISSNTSSLEKRFRGSQEARKSQVVEPYRSEKNPKSFIGGRSPFGSRHVSSKTVRENSSNRSKSSKDGRSFASFREDARSSKTHERLSHIEKRHKRSRKSEVNRDTHEKEDPHGLQIVKRSSSKNTQSSSFTWGGEPEASAITKTLREEESSKHKKGDSSAADSKAAVSKATDSKAADSKAAGSKVASSKVQTKPTAPDQAPKRPIIDFQRRLTTLEKHRSGYSEKIPGMVRSPRSYAERVRQPQKVVEKPTAVRTEIRLYPDLSRSQPGSLDCRTPCHTQDDDSIDNSTYPAEIINLRDSRTQTDSLRNIFVPESNEQSRRITASSVGSQLNDRFDNLRSPYRRTYDAEHHRYRKPPVSVVTIGQPDQRNVTQNRIPRQSQLREKIT